MEGRSQLDLSNDVNNDKTPLAMEDIPFDSDLETPNKPKFQALEIIDPKEHAIEAKSNFMNKYAHAFMIALQNYTNAKPRIGYTFGWFTWFRHGFNERKQFADNFKRDFFYADTDEDAKTFLEQYFKHKETKYNDHSFSRYLLDELQLAYADENWERFDPTPIVFYSARQADSKNKGYLHHDKIYLGCIASKDIHFEKGFFDEQPSPSIHAYWSQFNYFTHGIVMTKNYGNAEFTAKKPWQVKTHHGIYYAQHPNTYVFVINYRGKKAVDIGKTFAGWNANSVRSLTTAVYDETDAHVVGIEHVSPKDIMGAWELFERKDSVWHHNPHYKSVRQSKVTSQPGLFSTPQRMKAIFEDDHARLEKTRPAIGFAEKLGRFLF